jgi:hypothetical protein
VSAKETVKVGADLVALTLAESVALSTSGLKKVCTLLRVTYRTVNCCALNSVLELAKETSFQKKI